MANPLAKIRLQIVYLKLAVNAIPQPVKRMLQTPFFCGRTESAAVYNPGAVCYTYTEFLCAEGKGKNRDGHAA